MIFTIFVLWTLLGVCCVARSWLKGEDVIGDPKSFGVFVVLSLIEGLALVTTLIPPNAGLLAGCLFGFWLLRHLFAGKAIVEGKVVPNKKLGWSILWQGIFLGLVTISYFGS